MPGKIRQYFSDRKDDVQDYTGGGVVGKFILAVVVVYLLVALVLGMIWSSEPDVFSYANTHAPWPMRCSVNRWPVSQQRQP